MVGVQIFSFHMNNQINCLEIIQCHYLELFTVEVYNKNYRPLIFSCRTHWVHTVWPLNNIFAPLYVQNVGGIWPLFLNKVNHSLKRNVKTCLNIWWCKLYRAVVAEKVVSDVYCYEEVCPELPNEVVNTDVMDYDSSKMLWGFSNRRLSGWTAVKHNTHNVFLIFCTFSTWSLQ